MRVNLPHVSLLVWALLSIPPLMVAFPPITDLPQHLGQVYLLGEILSGSSEYMYRWWSPYQLGYIPMFLGHLAGAGWDLKVSVLLMLGIWTASVLALSRATDASAWVVLPAGILAYNSSFYWGFFPFFAGFLPFSLFFLLITYRDHFSRTAFFLLGVLTLALVYFTHALWFGVALAWMSVVFIRTHDKRVVLLLLPSIAVGVLVFLALRNAGFTSETVWHWTPFARFSWEYWNIALMGGNAGVASTVASASVLVCLLSAVVSPREGFHEELSYCGALLVGLSFTLPNMFSNTVFFADRFLSVGVVMILIARFEVRSSKEKVGLVAAFTAFLITTSLAWQNFNRNDMAGLTQSIQALTAESRVLQMDWLQASREFPNKPFLNAVVYSQIWHHTKPNLTFATFGSVPIVFRDRKPQPWDGLEQLPHAIGPEHLMYFDFVLVNGNDSIHSQMAKSLPVKAGHSNWRLYQIPQD